MSAEQRVRRNQLIQHAEGYLELGMTRHALSMLERLDAIAYADAHVLYLRGEVLRSLERHAEAVEWLGQSADLDPDNIHVWLALGWCYKRLGRLEQAIESLEEGLDAEPDEAILHYNLACYHSLAGDKIRALDYLARALEMDAAYREMVHDEHDFDSLRSDPDFLELTSVIV